MNNLKNLKVRCLPLDNIKGKIIHISLGDDRKKKEIYYLHDGRLNHVDLEKAEETTICSEIYNVIRIEFMIGHNKISVCTKRDIFIIDCETKEYYKRHFEEIHQTGWSTSFDNLAVLFKNGQLSTFSFDTRCELIDLATSNIHAPVPQQQSVGWGSQDTQFQGPSLPPEVNIGEPHHVPTDNRIPIISWRGNGDEFVITFVEKNIRIFKVFDDAGSPRARSELTKGRLYGPIAWKPEGNVIAAAMFYNGKNCIGLFERNGLFRMYFPLVDVFHPITSLSWSFCGKVLIVCQDDKVNSHLCLYTTCNMKWFLKQHLVFNTSNPLSTYTWIPTDPQCLEFVAITQKEIIEYKYKFQFDYERNHNMIVAVNGKTLRIHGFSMSIDPSPSCTSVQTFNNPFNMLAFHPDKDLFAAIDSANVLYTFDIVDNNLNLKSESPLGAQSFPLKMNHLFWKGDNPYVLVENPSQQVSILYEFNSESKQLEEIQQFDVKEFPIEHVYTVDNIIVKHDAKHRTVHRVQETPVTSLNVSYPYQVLALKFESDIYSLVLNPNQDLFFEEELVCRGITSMLIHKGYLLLTDNDALYTLKLDSQCVETLAADGLSEFHSRSLNELSYLVCMMGDEPKIILHTPRGNLEIVPCRSMEIRMIEDLLSKGEWAEAIKMMRLSRLDWNLLIDLDPERFYNNISKVVSESHSQHTLNSIVTEISDENCLITIYKHTIDKIPFLMQNKRSEFLRKLSNHLDESGSFINYLPTVVKVCLDQNNVQKALNYLSYLMKSNGDKPKLDQAIAQLRIRVEAADLFKAALFTFDIELAEYVAQQCQINPQEVGPFLEELKKMEIFERRIYIHVKYHNWDVAVTYMLNRNPLDKKAILEFIIEHDVAKAAYMEAIKLKQIDFMEDIAELYVQKLIQKRKHNEAGIILVKYLRFDGAIEQFKLALDHKKCIEYLPLTSFSEESKRQLFAELAQKLIAAKRVHAAAIIYETQLQDYTTAVLTLTEGGLFTDALRIAKEQNMADMIDLLILPKMFSMVQKLKEMVEDTSVKFKRNLQRLKRLRNDKKYLFEKSMKRRGLGGSPRTEDFSQSRNDGMETPTNQDFDLMSILSHKSTVSTHSSSTTITQKQIRKMEKLKQDTTEGSKLEDIALIREMHIMISLIFKYGPEAKELFLRLIEYSIMDLTTLHQHHQRLYDLQVLMKDEVYNIWDEDFVFRHGSHSNYINENYFFIDEQFRTIPTEVENPGLTWVLEIFKQ